MTVRPATASDLPAILEIYNEAVRDTTATCDYEPATLEQRQTWLAEHVQANYPVLVAAHGPGRVVGWSSLSRHRQRPGYRFTTENSVYVAADCRGQGIGKRLLAPLIEVARERGCHAILAGIDAANEASLRRHAHFGFEEVAHFEQIGFKFGRWLDVVYLEKLL